MEPKLFYQQPAARVGDVIPKYIDGKYQLFYLKNWRDHNAPGFVPGWHRMETTDLVHMGPESPIGVVGGTGDLIQDKDGVWHLFACIFPEGKQFVTHYISPDGCLDHWELQEEDTFGPDGEIYHCSDWRDPRIVYREDLGEYWMYLAARMNLPHSQTGCVGLCVSKDLKTWEYRQPAYFPQRFNGACECPDFFTMGDWEYLVFSSYTTLFGNYYVKRKAGESQWRIPQNHRLDSRAFYAAKTAGHDSERYLFGWNPTKERDDYGFWPARYHGQDYRTWDWGGSMVVHQLRQLPDGDLAVCLPAQKAAAFTQPVPYTPPPCDPGLAGGGGQACFHYPGGAADDAVGGAAGNLPLPGDHAPGGRPADGRGAPRPGGDERGLLPGGGAGPGAACVPFLDADERRGRQDLPLRRGAGSPPAPSPGRPVPAGGGHRGHGGRGLCQRPGGPQLPDVRLRRAQLGAVRPWQRRVYPIGMER